MVRSGKHPDIGMCRLFDDKAPTMILQLGLETASKSSNEFNEFYDWAYTQIKNSTRKQNPDRSSPSNDHRALSRSLDEYIIEGLKGTDTGIHLEAFVPSFISRLNKRLSANDTEEAQLNLFMKRYTEDLRRLQQILMAEATRAKDDFEFMEQENNELESVHDFLTGINLDDAVWDPLRNWMQSFSKEKFNFEIQKRSNDDIPKDFLSELYDYMESDQGDVANTRLDDALQIDYKQKPSGKSIIVYKRTINSS